MSLDIEISVTYIDSSRKIRQTWAMVNIHWNDTLYTFHKYNEWSVCKCNPKLSFYDNKDVMSTKYIKYVIINVTRLETIQRHLTYIE